LESSTSLYTSFCQTKRSQAARGTAILYREIFKRAQINIAGLTLASNYAGTGVIDLVNDAINRVTFFKVNQRIVQFDTGSTVQLAINETKCIFISICHIVARSSCECRLPAQPFGTHISNTERQSFTSIGT